MGWSQNQKREERGGKKIVDMYHKERRGKVFSKVERNDRYSRERMEGVFYILFIKLWK